jgi:hypothetical protein
VKRRLSALLALVLLAAAGAAGCGGGSQADLAGYLGTWQRVEGGVPNPGFTLTITRQDASAGATFENHVSGLSETVAAAVEDGYLVCTLPTGAAGAQRTDGGAAQGALALASPEAGSPVPDPPGDVDLQLSIDENGQLVVDLVLADGTLEPVWIYDRAEDPGPSGL